MMIFRGRLAMVDSKAKRQMRNAAGCVCFFFPSRDPKPHVDGPRKCDEISKNLLVKTEQSGEILYSSQTSYVMANS